MTLHDVEGAPFHDVRDALVTSDGSVVIADGGSNELRVYRPDGTLRQRLGGTGGGPGQFGDLGWLDMYQGDTVAAYDRRARTVTLFGPDFQLGRSFQITAAPYGVPTRVELIGIVEVSQFLGAVRPPPSSSQGRSTTSVLRIPTTLLLLREASGDHKQIGEVPGDEIAVLQGIVARLDFLRKTYQAVGENGVYIATSDSMVVEHVDVTGRTKRVIDSPVTGPALTRAASEEARRLGVPPELLPDNEQAIAQMVVDEDGRLWVGHNDSGGATDSHRYLVLESTGDQITVQMPPRSRVLTARDELVVLLIRDDLGIESVRLISLHWSSAD